jgi:hypothetical protein
MGNFQKYWSQNVGQDFIVLDFFLLGGDRAGGKGVCGRLMSPVHETQSMREIRLLCGRLPRKGGGLTGMFNRIPRETVLWDKYWQALLPSALNLIEILLSNKCSALWLYLQSYLVTIPKKGILKIKNLTNWHILMELRRIVPGKISYILIMIIFK